MTWPPAPLLRTLALVFACVATLWMLGRGQGHAALRDQQSLRGDDGRELQNERHAPAAAELVAAIADDPSARLPVSVESPVADKVQDWDPDETTDPVAEPPDDRVHPFYTFWDDSGGPPVLDDELTLTLVERADGAAFEPWSASVEIGAVRNLQPKHTVAMPLPAPGLYRATCRDGRYEPTYPRGARHRAPTSRHHAQDREVGRSVSLTPCTTSAMALSA